MREVLKTSFDFRSLPSISVTWPAWAGEWKSAHFISVNTFHICIIYFAPEHWDRRNCRLYPALSGSLSHLCLPIRLHGVESTPGGWVGKRTSNLQRCKKMDSYVVPQTHSCSQLTIMEIVSCFLAMCFALSPSWKKMMLEYCKCEAKPACLHFYERRSSVFSLLINMEV